MLSIISDHPRAIVFAAQMEKLIELTIPEIHNGKWRQLQSDSWDTLSIFPFFDEVVSFDRNETLTWSTVYCEEANGGTSCKLISDKYSTDFFYTESGDTIDVNL